MRFASLGSGSEGNGLIVESQDGGRSSRLMIDCGFSLKESERRLRAAGLEPDQLDAILVTHEHGDHIDGVFRLASAYAIPVYLTHGTLTAGGAHADRCEIRIILPDLPFELVGFGVMPVAVPHDAREPVQYVIDDGRLRLGVLTDIGHGTPHVQRAYSGLDALVLECNHDAGLLASNPRYPDSLKRRIGGPYGHLANADAATILAGLERGRLRTVVAAHLSRHNNTEALARQALVSVLGEDSVEVAIAAQDSGFDWISL